MKNETNPDQLKQLAWRSIRTANYWLHRKRHKSHIVFIAGLPKAGTTWLAQMFAEVPGFFRAAPSHISQTDHDLNNLTFREFNRQLVVLHLHLAWSPDNGRILERENQKYVVLFRDLRDTVVSWYHYVTKVNHKHFLHQTLRGLSLAEGIDYYIEHYLEREVEWIRGWRENRHPVLSVETRYEDLRANTLVEFSRLVSFFGLKVSTDKMQDLVRRNSFEYVTNRRQGQEDTSSHQRKGIVGDWKNAFQARHIEAFKHLAGELLIELGYEENTNWLP